MSGIAASVWGQIYKVEPVIVIELVQEQINNKLPDDARQLLTGVHHNVLGYDESDKLRPVGSLDAITKIAQVTCSRSTRSTSRSLLPALWTMRSRLICMGR